MEPRLPAEDARRMNDDPGADPPPVNELRPVPRAERLVALDFVRGIAVLGILFANIVSFAHPGLAYSWPGALPGGGNSLLDQVIWLFQFVLVDGKFRGLFALLFGAGLVLFVERARERGDSGALQLRRLTLLALFGLAHFFLLYTGDILFLYAVAGVIALGFVDLPARRLLLLGTLWYVVATVLLAALSVTPAMLEMLPALRQTAALDWTEVDAVWQAQVAAAEAERAVMTSGSFADIVSWRLANESSVLAAYAILAALDAAPVMLLGMALYKTQAFSSQAPGRKMLRWAWAGIGFGVVSGLAIGLVVLALGFPPDLTLWVNHAAAAPFRLPMILGLALLLAAWSPRAAATLIGRRLVAAGRMAFTNYIATSLIMALVFQGWAGGWFGLLNRAELLIPVALGWVLMLSWSAPWLVHFRYGPLEWLWRCLTYRRRFALVR